MALGLAPAWALAGLGAAVAVTVVALAVDPPPVGRGTVLAAAPWAVAAALLRVLALVGAYDPPLSGILGSVLVYPAAAAVAGATWFLVDRLSTFRETAASDRYLGSAGVGVVVALGAVLFLRVDAGPTGFVWLLVPPVAAGAIAAALYFALGLTDATVLARTRLAGLLAVFAHAFDGVAVVVALDALGHRPRSRLVAELAEVAGTLPVAARAGVGWPFLVLSLAFALVAAWVLARDAVRAPARAYLLLAAVVVAGLAPGTTTLLAAVLS